MLANMSASPTSAFGSIYLALQVIGSPATSSGRAFAPLVRTSCHHSIRQCLERSGRFDGRPSFWERPGHALPDLEHDEGEVVFRRACQLGLEGIVSKRLGSSYRSGRSRDWLKMNNPAAPAVKREAEEDWGR
jgi:hypothetical protein